MKHYAPVALSVLLFSAEFAAYITYRAGAITFEQWDLLAWSLLLTFQLACFVGMYLGRKSC